MATNSEMSLSVLHTASHEDDSTISGQENSTGTYYKETPANNSRFLTIYLIVNTMIGSGILNQPNVFKHSGVVGALLAFLFVTYFTWLGMAMTAEVAIELKIFDYNAMIKHVYGVRGEKFFAAAIIFYGFGGILSYVTIIGGTTADLLRSWGCEEGGCTIFTFTVILMYVFEFPLALRRYFGHMGYLSIFSISTIVLCVGFVLFAGPVCNEDNRHDKINIFNVAGMFSKLGSIVFALSCNQATGTLRFDTLKV